MFCGGGGGGVFKGCVANLMILNKPHSHVYSK